MTVAQFLLILPAFMLLVAIAMRSFAVRMGWIEARRRRLEAAAAFLPASAPPPARTARIVEAVALAIAGVVVVIAWRASTGLFLRTTEHSTAVNMAFACSLVGVGVALLLVLRGHTLAGAAVLFTVVSVSGFVPIFAYGPPSLPLLNLTSGSDVSYTIDFQDTNVKGADLWVNGVYLGKTPYTTTLREFEARVPYWANKPADYETDKVETPHYTPRGPVKDKRYRWIQFMRSPSVGSSVGRPPSGSILKTAYYYAKVRYASQWGLAGLGSSSGSTIGQTDSSFDVIFRGRDQRLATLLNLARLAHYQVGAEWFQAAESYNGDAWLALGKAAEDEPPMWQLRDAWAAWHYGLDKVTDADSAWTIFQQICDEADARQQYLTDSIAGRAVELLVPKLPQERLVDDAAKLIRETRAYAYSYSYWRANDRLQFSYRGRPGRVNVGGAFVTNSGAFMGQRWQFPAHGFAVAHAVWMLDEQSRSPGRSLPTIVQEQIVPEILRWHYQDNNEALIRIVAHFGGPAADKFFLRQDWSAAPPPYDFVNSMNISGKDINKWLFALAYLNDDAGEQFRLMHSDRIMDLARKMCQSYAAGAPDFIFRDAWLAKLFWPEFARHAREEPARDPVRTQWEYLARMGDAATIEMFMGAWTDSVSVGDFWNALGALDKMGPPKKQELIGALVQRLREHPKAPKIF